MLLLRSRHTFVRRLLPIAALGAAPLAVSSLAVPAGTAVPAPASRVAAAPAEWFARTATYPVFQNVPAGVDPAATTVAEISDVTDDGNTVVYTDAAGGRIGFLDITDPGAPRGAGTYELAADDSPTSVAVVGDHVLVVVDTSAGDLVNPDGRLDVIRIADHSLAASIDLDGQPDSIAIAPSGDYAAIAIENQRDEEFTPDGGDEGDLPQPPAGFVQVLEIDDPDPSAWTAQPVALPASELTGMDTPEDAEPEYVDIDEDDRLAVSLQENNGVVVIDLPTASIEAAWSAGNAIVEGVDTTDDGVFNPVDNIDVPREPDSLQWVGDGLVATANEGDWKGGSRGWTVFAAATGEVVWDAGNSFEQLAIRYGLFNDGRADNKGPEPEGMAFDTYDGTPYVFVGSERSNFVAVYDMTDPTAPDFQQLLPATNGPEGLLPVPGRDLLVVSSEEDDAEVLVRATVSVFELGDRKPAFPSIVSTNGPGADTAIGWGALGALSGAPGRPNRAWTASDAAFTPARIYGVDVASRPAVIDEVIEVTGGATGVTDIEGLAARTDGGFWIANEGTTGAGNFLARTDAEGVVQEEVMLPDEVADHVGKWGLEGVAARGRGAREEVYVVLQRPLWEDPAASPLVPLDGDVARIGRYRPDTADWTWFSYELEPTSIDGDWVGLSEITVLDRDTIAVIERDKQNGTTAAIKRVYAVDVPATTTDPVTPLTKRLAIDLLPRMHAQRGWAQEKLEGLTVTAAGQVLAVTDNDGVDDATGETQLYRLGNVRKVFGHATVTRVKGPRRASKGERFRVTVTVRRAEGGKVRLTGNGRVIAVRQIGDGTVTFAVRRGRAGVHRLRATYLGHGLAHRSSDLLKVHVHR